MNIPWWGYVILAGLAWGTYVPIIFYGGSVLGGTVGSRLMAILCVGGAYFVLGVLFPLAVFLSGQQAWPPMRTTGLLFASLAGVAGAVGAICVIFASSAAVAQARAENVNPATYRMYIAPLIFGLAPVINTLIASVWHPNARTGDTWLFHLELPGWKLLAGIVLVGVGVYLVLMSKEEAEAAKGGPAPPTPATAPAPHPAPHPAPPAGS
jgi:drug/metabolite transporter (DMT)-like permease